MKAKAKNLLSTQQQLSELAGLVKNYVRLPFSPLAVPGAVVEGVLAHVRGAKVLDTYDFVDVVDRQSKIGWQVKSTLAGTPITWKRVKLEGRNDLIAKSEASSVGVQKLGDEIIAFCNEHVKKSFDRYELEEIGYARLIVHKDRQATFFERLLCTRADPTVFNPRDFIWAWSKKKETKGKEQLSALHGTHIPTGRKWFAWHGRGENQLHFSGEGSWWPVRPNESSSISFRLPSEAQRLSIENFVALLASADNPLPKIG